MHEMYIVIGCEVYISSAKPYRIIEKEKIILKLFMFALVIHGSSSNVPLQAVVDVNSLTSASSVSKV